MDEVAAVSPESESAEIRAMDRGTISIITLGNAAVTDVIRAGDAADPGSTWWADTCTPIYF